MLFFGAFLKHCCHSFVHVSLFGSRCRPEMPCSRAQLPSIHIKRSNATWLNEDRHPSLPFNILDRGELTPNDGFDLGSISGTPDTLTLNKLGIVRDGHDLGEIGPVLLLLSSLRNPIRKQPCLFLHGLRMSIVPHIHRKGPSAHGSNHPCIDKRRSQTMDLAARWLDWQ